MCGIAGLVPTRPIDGAIVRAMARRLVHRGPDDEGWATVGDMLEVGREWPVDRQAETPLLLHTRLSILDLSAAGHQPMTRADGRFVLAYNGEIYNYVELRDELRASGHRFATGTDTEVLLAAWEAWGPAALDRLVGMFAFALVDREAQTLFLVRDPFGIKPLYYARGDGGLVFGSEIPTLLEVPWVRRDADLRRVLVYLLSGGGLNAYGSDTMFDAVKQVPAGHWARVRLETDEPPVLQRYWRPEVHRARDVPYPEAVAEVRRRFLENVRLHMRSDVRVGAALSGGIDSSSIVMAMRHVAGPDVAIRTFSYIADDPGLSEERWVDLVNAAAGAKGHKLRPTTEDLELHIERLIESQGEPFGTTSIFAQFCVFQAAGERDVTVMLDGQGADEMLAGYAHYRAPRVASLVRAGRLHRAWRAYQGFADQAGTDRARLRREVADHLLPGRFKKLLSGLGVTGRERRPAWLDQGWLDARGVRPAPVPVHRAKDAMRHDLAASIAWRGLPALLRYEDRNSMAFSIESRVPFLTADFVQYLLSLPEEYLLDDKGTTKRVFRDAMRGIVPDEILDRRDKIGFATTESEWMRGRAEWVRTILARASGVVPFLDSERLVAEWSRFLRRERGYSPEFWRWVNLVLWSERFGVTYP